MSEPGPYRPQYDAHVQAKYAAESKAEGDRKMKRAWRILEAGLVRARTCDAERREGNSGTMSARPVESVIDEMRIVRGYAPGSGNDPDAVIAFGNWNTISGYGQEWNRARRKGDDLPPKLARLLEKAGVEVEWYDEWTECAGCNMAIRTQPNGFSWTPGYGWVSDCEILCEGCIADDPVDYLERCEGSDDCVIEAVNPAEHGYKPQGGIGTDRHRYTRKMKKEHGIERIIFQQDDREFIAFVHEDEAKYLPRRSDSRIWTKVRRMFERNLSSPCRFSTKVTGRYISTSAMKLLPSERPFRKAKVEAGKPKASGLIFGMKPYRGPLN